MQKNATGRLRWLPDYFLLQTLEDTLIAIDGYYEGERDFEKMLRRHAGLAVAPYAEKGFAIEKYWPIWGDEELRIQKLKDDRIAAKLMKYRNAAKAEQSIKAKESKHQNGN